MTNAGTTTQSVSSIYDVHPQLANLRAYKLGYGWAGRLDGVVTAYRSGVDHPMFNGILRVGPGGLDAALVEAGRLDGLPWLWWVGVDSYPELAADLRGRGATEVGPLAVMAVHVDRVTELPGPPDLLIDDVRDPGDLREWVAACADVCGMAPDLVDPMLAREAAHPAGGRTLARFAGRLDGRIVGTAALLDEAGVAGIHTVTTAEAYRRRGVAAALTGVALRITRWRGLKVATLQASDPGARVYRDMGFEQVAEYRMFRL
ncbi:GNAT family N-acetyltransferase [Phytohabitans houttuyneae]|uniref:Acetyltransferase n=1 Tax=Phytohabitans houttuyneae TaxID=1076126 RepID=A0A6V8KDS1_9ACTN|nr:GNAT family N-acetyltransferase [Phytohabitans houttuyneae]GFJ83363.1 acetyltransferase [Phytohabitans houttuyneae]